VNLRFLFLVSFVWIFPSVHREIPTRVPFFFDFFRQVKVNLLWGITCECTFERNVDPIIMFLEWE
jgi:hypothetical protein